MDEGVSVLLTNRKTEAVVAAANREAMVREKMIILMNLKVPAIHFLMMIMIPVMVVSAAVDLKEVEDLKVQVMMTSTRIWMNLQEMKEEVM
jgi:hypothetical protein